MPRGLLGGQLSQWALRLDKNIGTLGVAQAEKAAWREVAGKGRGHHPHWPPSQAHHSSRTFYDSDPMGIPLLGEAANPHPSEWEGPPTGTEGNKRHLWSSTEKNASSGGSRPDSHSGSHTSCVTLCKLLDLSGPQFSYLYKCSGWCLLGNVVVNMKCASGGEMCT